MRQHCPAGRACGRRRADDRAAGGAVRPEPLVSEDLDAHPLARAPAPREGSEAEHGEPLEADARRRLGDDPARPFLSVVTVMLVLVYLFTLRRSSILTPHYMNTADVLLKKRDYLGLLAISSRHSEAVARVVQRTLDFATKNPNASFETVRDIAETEGSAARPHRSSIARSTSRISACFPR